MTVAPEGGSPSPASSFSSSHGSYLSLPLPVTISLFLQNYLLNKQEVYLGWSHSLVVALWFAFPCSPLFCRYWLLVFGWLSSLSFWICVCALLMERWWV